MVIPKATNLQDDLARMMREREFSTAPEPDGSIGTNSEDGVAYGLSVVQSAGYTYLWNTQDHERSRFNNNGVLSKLRERFPVGHAMAGQYAWVTEEPTEKPFRGTAVCPLHASKPEREEYIRKGYPACDRINLPNEFESREHLRLKHPRTWKAMQDEIAATERGNAADDRRISREMLERLADAATGPTLAESQEHVARMVETVSNATMTVTIPSGFYLCTRCQKNHRATSKRGTRHYKYRAE